MTANPIERLDVPLTAVEAEAARFIAWKREVAAAELTAGLVDDHHLIDPLDHAFEAIPLAHPELIPDNTWTPGSTA
ncbi:hypothetical protein OG209_05510 [Streptomyces sp. NBC_01383]|uniref:hypothetical protein n=1 Tax=Streptomyces sp. NBC_01383 TaxID=2903846 RepID=UPI00324A81CF